MSKDITIIQLENIVKDLKKEVAEQKQLNEELRANKNRLSIMIEHSTDSFMLHNMDGRILDVNHHACVNLGYTRDEMLSMYISDIDEEFISGGHQKIWRNMRLDSPINFEGIHKRKDGSKFPVEIRLVLFESANQKYMLGIVRDISDRKRYENELRENEESYRQLFEHAGVSMILSEIESGRLVKFNRMAYESLGYTKEEYKNIAINDLNTNGSIQYVKKHLKKIEAGNSDVFETRLRAKNGKVKDVLVSAVPLSIQGKKFIHNIRIDITARKKAEEALRKAHDKLEARVRERTEELVKSNQNLTQEISERKKLENKLLQTQKMEAISSLAGGIAHQFNNSIMGITANLELLQMTLPGDQNLKKCADTILLSADRMTQLTKQLLAYARGGKYLAQNINLRTLLRDTLPLFKHNLQHSVIVKSFLPEDLLDIKADLPQMQVILSTILTNASEAIKSEGCITVSCENINIKEHVKNSIIGLKPGKYVTLTIKDNGSGMTQDSLKRVFDPFFTTKFQGRGLGMAAVYGIIKNHSGWIDIESKIGEGTVVKIYLPAMEPFPNIQKESAADIPKGVGNVLIVEDEYMVMEATLNMLKNLGYNTLTAKNGKEAFAISKSFKGKIDLVLLDLILPDIAAMDIYKTLTKYHPGLKVLVCSGYSIDSPVKDILDAGAQGFIQKPFTLKSLSKKLKAVMG